MQETLAGGSVFPEPDGSCQSVGTSGSLSRVRSTNVNTPSTSLASDISHLVRKKRKPKESPVKKSDSLSRLCPAPLPYPITHLVPIITACLYTTQFPSVLLIAFKLCV
ncbi:hypothetical protein DPEC_G00200460 [Dallia pectoralis]|uniref:Uncharacterized protein n=1 Tax=Dallia pectoralis TaxID=75939 RepID=A0ACC2G8S6_DALPE|nr:hypothetical protein DPEC_G00200460 [Dallia pectoralis]